MAPRRRAASGGFGYDPVFVPDDGDDGRTMAELTDDEKDAHLAPRPRRPGRCWHGSRDDRDGRARRRGSTLARARRVSIVSNTALILLKVVAGALTGSVAILTEAIHSAIDLIASIVAFFSVRQAESPPTPTTATATRSSRTSPPAVEGDADPRRLRRDRLRRGPPPRSTAPSSSRSASASRVVAFATAVNLVVSSYLYRARPRDRLAGARGRRRPPAHRRLHVARRARRPRRWSRSPARTWLDPVVALADRRRDRRTPACGSSRGSWRVLVDEALPDDETAAIREAIEASAPAASSATTSCAPAARARAATSTCTSSSAPARRSRTRTRIAHELQDAIRGDLRGADVLIHLEPEDRVRPGRGRSRADRRLIARREGDGEQHPGVADVAGEQEDARR